MLSSDANAVPTNSAVQPILIVDDDVAILDMLQMLFEEEGYAVVAASNGADAFSLAQQHPLQLVLTDLMMPRMDGHTLALRLRAFPATAHLPIVLMSAAPQPDLYAPFTAVIPKPFVLGHLLEQVQRLIHHHS